MAITLHTDTQEKLPEQTELAADSRIRDDFQKQIDRDVETLKTATAKAAWPEHVAGEAVPPLRCRGRRPWGAQVRYPSRGHPAQGRGRVLPGRQDGGRALRDQVPRRAEAG